MHTLKVAKTKSEFGKFFALSAICAGVYGVNALPSNVSAAPRVDRSAQIVVDADTGNILYEDNATARRYPASITKVMTLYLLFEAIESGRVSLDDQIVFSRNADRQPPTALGTRAGDSISVETAILSLALRSANDTATAVAEFLGGTEAQFAQMMTQKAQALGMNSSNFANASGLPNPRQYTTAEDIAKLAIAIRRDFPRQYHWFSRTSFVYQGQIITNHNHLVGQIEGVDGLKTGYIGASGFNLAASATRGGHRIVTVVMGGSNRHVRDDRVVALIENAFVTLGVARMAQNENSNFWANGDDIRDNADSFALMSPSTAGSNSPVRVNLAANAIAPATNSGANGFTWRTPVAPTQSTTIAAPLPNPPLPNPPLRSTTLRSNMSQAIATPTAPEVQIAANFEANANNIEAKEADNSANQEENEGAGNIVFVANQETTPQNANPETVQLAQVEVANDKQSQLPSFSVPKPAQDNIDVNIEAAPLPQSPVIMANNETSSPLPLFTVSSPPSETPAAQPGQTENVLVAMNAPSPDNLEEIQNMRVAAQMREQERLRDIIEDENLERARVRAREEQRRSEERRLARIEEARQTQLAQNEARNARARAEREERERQLALANNRGNVTVQIGAFKERGDAQQTLAQMARHFPSFASKQVTTFENSGSTWFRARISGLGMDAAQAACRAVTQSGGRCSIVGR